ncbi:hypothetical protein PENTCL1PPCAC_15146, partial [Pristionchus entomophagus]
SLGTELLRILEQRIVRHQKMDVTVDPRVLGDDGYPDLDVSDGHSLHIRSKNVRESLQLQNAGARETDLRLISHERDSILAHDRVHFLSQFILNLGILGEYEHGPSQR